MIREAGAASWKVEHDRVSLFNDEEFKEREGKGEHLSRNCRACAAEVAATDDICPHCLASLEVVDYRFTTEVAYPPSERGSATPSTQLSVPNLDTISFVPSSAFYRLFQQLRGGLLSAMVAFFFIVAGGFWWTHSHRDQGLESAQMAEALFEDGKYASAVTAWDESFQAYQYGFDENGQVEALLGLSRCHIRAKDFSEALAVLQRAQKIQPDDSVDEALKKTHRMAAAEHLTNAQELFTPDSFGKAFLEAELAVDGFEKGEGTESQRAGAYRMAARCSIKLNDFEGAESYLSRARECEGESKPNKSLAADLERVYNAHRSKVLADSGANGYIPQGKIDPLAIEQAATKYAGRRGYNRAYARTYSSYSGSTQRLSSSQYRNTSTYQYKKPPKRIRTSVGGDSSYPTAQRKRTRYRSDDYLHYQPARYTSGRPSSATRNLRTTPRLPSTIPNPYKRPQNNYKPPTSSSYRAPVNFKSPTRSSGVNFHSPIRR